MRTCEAARVYKLKFDKSGALYAQENSGKSKTVAKHETERLYAQITVENYSKFNRPIIMFFLSIHINMDLVPAAAASRQVCSQEPQI